MLLKSIHTQKKYLLAVSGGIDSMVMCALFLTSGAGFGVAHCNFQLRAEESDGDEAFVKNWCKQNGVPFYSERFETKSFAEINKLSVQVAARNLRYRFFSALAEKEKYDLIATAHHRDDDIETVLFHFMRGTGIQGLTGIPAKNGIVVRPLLSYTREDILDFAQENNIVYRNDSSNQKTDYTRNKLRNVIIPQLQELFPSFRQNIAHNIDRLSEVNEIYQQQIKLYRKKLLEARGKDFYIPILKLRHLKPLPTILYEILKPFQFSYEQTLQLMGTMESESGRKVENENYFILKNRNFFIISSKDTVFSEMIQIEKGTEKLESADFKLKIKKTDKNKFHLQKDQHVCQVDAELINYPMLLRKWRPGDYMYPLGMKKKKKIARILIDLKMPVHEKENVWVLETDKKIVWLAGLKLDERFKVQDKTREILLITISKNNKA